MNTIVLCTTIAMNIFSLPAGNHVVGTTMLGDTVVLQDRSFLGDWVFIGSASYDSKYNYQGAISRGSVPYANMACDR